MHSAETITPREARIKRLIYQSWYRGCKETDILLGGFAKAHLQELDDAGLDSFEALLGEHDADVFAWLTDVKPVPPQFKDDKTYLQIYAYCRREK